jgi:hypothetical protein
MMMFRSTLCLLLVQSFALAQVQPPKKRYVRPEDDYDRLKKGDYSHLDQIAAHSPAEALPKLYSQLLSSTVSEIKGPHPEAEGEIAARIARIPGHAKFVADKIEELSKQHGTGRDRDEWFYRLSLIGSEESVETLGSYLRDKRGADDEGLLNPEANLIVDNRLCAAVALGHIFGDKAPTKRKPMLYGPREVAQWQVWWDEREKQKKAAGTGKASVPDPAASATPSGSTAPSDGSSSSRTWRYWVLSAFIIASGGVWLARRLRRHRLECR